MLQKRDYHYRGYIKGFGMVGAICGSEIALIENLKLFSKDKDKNLLNSWFFHFD